MMKKIFVTGGTGFVGGQLLKSLRESGYTVLALTRPSSDRTLLDSLGVTAVAGDVAVADTYRDFLEEVDCVFHLAAEVSDWAPAVRYERTNIIGTKSLLEAACAAHVKRIVYVSTIDVLARRPVIDESVDYTRCRLPYHKTKMIAEKHFVEFCSSHGIEGVVIRPAWVYGAGDRTLVPEIVKQFRDPVFPLVGKPDTCIPLIHVANLVEVLLRCMTASLSDGEVRCFVAADDVQITWKEFVMKIADLLNVCPRYIFIPFGVAYWAGMFLETLGRIRKRKDRPLITRTSAEMMSAGMKVDSSKLKAWIGNYENLTLEEGLRQAVNSCLASD
jgi:nucleoside-diphosphate-sugar epimerase